MVSIKPTLAMGMSKLAPMALSRPTGTNSVVLNTKAASAKAMTGCQLAWGVAAEMLIGGRDTLAMIRRPRRTAPPPGIL